MRRYYTDIGISDSEVSDDVDDGSPGLGERPPSAALRDAASELFPFLHHPPPAQQR